jgi:hypothetical protein
MFIVVSIWLFSFFTNFEAQRIEEESEARNAPSLFESIGKDFSIIKQKLEASLKNIQTKGK